MVTSKGCVSKAQLRTFHIFSCLCDQIIPKNLMRNQKFKLLHNASHYTLVFSDLYRKGLDKMLLRCLELEDFEKAFVDVHDGICREYFNGLALSQNYLGQATIGQLCRLMLLDMLNLARNIS